MGCYSDRTKACCAKVVMFVSLAILLLGLITAVFGLMQMGVVQNPTNYTTFTFDESAFGMGILALGVLAIVIAVLGLMTAKCKKWCFTLLFIVLAAVVGLILLIVAFILMADDSLIEAGKEAACSTDVSAKANNQYIKTVDHWVCSTTCPCPEGPNGDWKKLWTSYSKDSMKSQKRAPTRNDLPDPGNWDGNKDNAEWTPLTFASSGETFESWEDCYFAKLEKQSKANPNDNKWKDMVAFMQTGGFDFLNELEESYDCASICVTPLFYLTRSIKEGRPETDCISGLIEGNQGTMNTAGIVSVLTALVLIIGAIGAFPLCSGFSDPDDK